MLACFRRHQHTKKSQTFNNVCTVIHYSRAGVPHAVMAQGGPGGSIILTDEEYQAIIKDVDIFTGASAAELSGKQILESKCFQEILKDQGRSPVQSPRSTHTKTKRK